MAAISIPRPTSSPPESAAATSGGESPDGPGRGSIEYLSALALQERLQEEVNRAGRHATALSCLLLDLEDLSEIERTHGAELAAHALAYVSLALRGELRGFDRVGRASEDELLIVLPGADGTRAEIVARRMLGRLRAIKLEAHGERRALRMAVGLAAWREGVSAEALVAQARAAAGRERLGFQDALRL